jgi:DNA-binding NtrC family response regulator
MVSNRGGLETTGNNSSAGGDTPRTILLVDDDDSVRKSLSMLFEIHGWNAVSASTGAEAIKTLENEAVDLVLTDIFMPDFDGLEMLREVSKRWPGLPAIVLSGQLNWGDIDWLRMARQMGAHAVLEKTSAFDDVLREVESALA